MLTHCINCVQYSKNKYEARRTTIVEMSTHFIMISTCHLTSMLTLVKDSVDGTCGSHTHVSIFSHVNTLSEDVLNLQIRV